MVFFPTCSTAGCQTAGDFDCPTKSIGPVTELPSSEWACLRISEFPFFLAKTWARGGTLRWKKPETFFLDPSDMTNRNWRNQAIHRIATVVRLRENMADLWRNPT